jgi:hypothetical protein
VSARRPVPATDQQVGEDVGAELIAGARLGSAVGGGIGLQPGGDGREAAMDAMGIDVGQIGDQRGHAVA